MKQIEEYIESNKKLLEERIKTLENVPTNDKEERQHQRLNIERIRYYIKGKEDGFKPKALVCYDTITHDDIAFARKYQLSLLLINTKKYEHTISFDENYEENTYVI